jgi:aminomethyltransferase
MELSGKRVPREGYAILHAGERVGYVTSGTFSPTFERPIAMGYVRPDAAVDGTEVEIDIRGRPETAHIVALPFYSR